MERAPSPTTEPLPNQPPELEPGQRPPAEVISSWDELTDPLNAWRFREAVTKKLHDEYKLSGGAIGELPKATKRHFQVWGINNNFSPDMHAIATYFGVSDEAWERQSSSSRLENDKDTDVPIDKLLTFHSFLQDSNLELRVQVAHPGIDLKSVPPMEISTRHDKLTEMDIAELDHELRQITDPRQKETFISLYLIPKIDKIEASVSKGKMDARHGQDEIEDVEYILGLHGVNRVTLSRGQEIQPEQQSLFDVLNIRGEGQIWQVESSSPGYYLETKRGVKPLRKAKVNVFRIPNRTIAVSSDGTAERLNQRGSTTAGGPRRKNAAKPTRRRTDGTATRSQGNHDHDGQQSFDDQWKTVARDPQYSELFKLQPLSDLYDGINDKVRPLKNVRLDELNQGKSDDDKINKLPADEYRQLVNPISDEAVENYIQAQGHSNVADDVKRAIKLAMLDAKQQLRRRNPRSGNRRTR